MRFNNLLIFGLFLILCVSSKTLHAKDLFVAPNGNDNVSYSENNRYHPWQSVAKAFTSRDIQAGDVVNFRDGEYAIISTIETRNGPDSTNGTASKPIVFKAYQNENVKFISRVNRAIYIDRDYYTVENIEFTAPGTFWYVGNTLNATNFVLRNCRGRLTVEGGSENLGCVRFQATRANNGQVINCHFTGPNAGGNINTAGVFVFRSQGIKVLYSQFDNFPRAIFYKHTCDNINTYIEFAYNYFHNNGSGIVNASQYAEIHNNLFVNCGVYMGEDGGTGDDGSNAGGDHNDIHHNTFYRGTIQLTRSSSNDGSGAQYNTIRNNVFTNPVEIFRYDSADHHTTMRQNLYPTSTAVINNRVNYSLSAWISRYSQDGGSIATTPPFEGGSSPTTIDGYSLNSTSDGLLTSSNISSFGADVKKISSGPSSSTNGSTDPAPDTNTDTTNTDTTNTDTTNTDTTNTDTTNTDTTNTDTTNTDTTNTDTTNTDTTNTDTTNTDTTNTDTTNTDTTNDASTSTTTSANAPVTPAIRMVEIDSEVSNGDIIFQDDFDGTASMAEKYVSYNSSNGDCAVVSGVGVDATKGLRVRWAQGQVDAGSFWYMFGRNPVASKSNSQTDFDDIYWRFYLRTSAGWTGNPSKLTRATIFSGSNWSQAMVAHVWGDTGDTVIKMDPASGVNGSLLATSGYNDFNGFDWLGAKKGVTPIYTSAMSNSWHLVEIHVKLNTPGSANGVFECWIDGTLEGSYNNLDWVGSWQQYGINAILFGNYWNGGAPGDRERYMDNLIVSTSAIGPAISPVNPVIYKTNFSDPDSGEAQGGFDVQVSESKSASALVWAGTTSGVANSLTLNNKTGIFQGNLAGNSSLNGSRTYYARVRQYDAAKNYSGWSNWYLFRTSAQTQIQAPNNLRIIP